MKTSIINYLNYEFNKELKMFKVPKEVYMSNYLNCRSDAFFFSFHSWVENSYFATLLNSLERRNIAYSCFNSLAISECIGTYPYFNYFFAKNFIEGTFGFSLIENSDLSRDYSDFYISLYEDFKEFLVEGRKVNDKSKVCYFLIKL